jgi:hypothetical protein
MRGGSSPEEMQAYEDQVVGEIAQLFATLDHKDPDYDAKSLETRNAAKKKMSSIKVMYRTGEIPPPQTD